MTRENYEILCNIASNLTSAKEIVSNAKFERLSRPLLEDSIDRAIALIACSLEALRDNKRHLFDDKK